jgi:hypothetical protein
MPDSAWVPTLRIGHDRYRCGGALSQLAMIIGENIVEQGAPTLIRRLCIETPMCLTSFALHTRLQRTGKSETGKRPLSWVTLDYTGGNAKSRNR